MADPNWIIFVNDLDNPTSEISTALTAHAATAVTTAVGPQVQAATDAAGDAAQARNDAQAAASAAQTSATAAATSATQAVSAAQTATTMAGQTVALQDAAVSELVSGETSTRGVLDLSYGGLPRAFLDASSHADGPVTSLDRGAFSSSYGNSPATIQSGMVTHTPSGSANTAAYVEGKLDSQVRRIGALAEFPDTNGGAVALVIPASSWKSQIGNAGIHVVFGGILGRVTASSYIGGTQTNIHIYDSTGPFTGRHLLEVSLDAHRHEISVWLDGARVLTYVDENAFAYLSEYAIWELFEATGTTLNPASLYSTWADVERLVPSALPLTSIPPASGKQTFGAAFNPGPYTEYPAGTTFANAGFGTLDNVKVPQSGLVEVQWTCWLDASAATGRIYGAVGVPPVGSQAIAAAGFVGRVVYHGVVSYTPGATVSIVPRIMIAEGSGKLVAGGAMGFATITATAID